jgi:hypothetical protein
MDDFLLQKIVPLVPRNQKNLSNLRNLRIVFKANHRPTDRGRPACNLPQGKQKAVEI